MQENERSKAHERLETETIKASIQRHKLQFLPERIAKEIKGDYKYHNNLVIRCVFSLLLSDFNYLHQSCVILPSE